MGTHQTAEIKTQGGIVAKATDDFEVEFHLTPNGWQRGSEWFFGELQAATPSPANRLLTLKQRIYQSSPVATPLVTWVTVWRKSGVPEHEIEELRKKFQLPVRQTA